MIKELSFAPGYFVNTEGRVFSGNYNKTGSFRELKQDIGKKGYHRVTMRIMKKRSRFLVHRLVAFTFIPNPDGLLQINHKDSNKSNNYSDNLEWCTPSFNIIHGIRNGARLHYKPATGSSNARSKLNIEKVKKIRELYKTGKYSQPKLCAMFSITQKPINDIIHNKTWRNI
jgi:hypothetical protein